MVTLNSDDLAFVNRSISGLNVLTMGRCNVPRGFWIIAPILKSFFGFFVVFILPSYLTI